LAIAGTGEEGIDGVVTRVSYLGDRREVSVETSAGILRVDADASHRFAAGDRVRISIKRCRVFSAVTDKL
jgi:hypothetical protein